MSKLDLIRAGHTEVADGQCGLCDVPWPCDTGVVLAALDAEAENPQPRYHAAESEEAVGILRAIVAGDTDDTAAITLTRRTLAVIADAIDQEIAFRAGFVRRYAAAEARAEAAEQWAALWKKVAKGYRQHWRDAMGYWVTAVDVHVERRKALEAELASARAALLAQQEHEDFMTSMFTLREGPSTDEDIEAAYDKSAALNMRALELRRAALAATPERETDEIVLPSLPTTYGLGTVVSKSVRPDLVLEEEPWCIVDRHIVLPSGEACVCGENRMELML